MHQRRYRLKGLNCANCAALIQDEIKRLDGVYDAQFTFATEMLSLSVEEDIKGHELSGQIKKIVLGHEPSVEVLDLEKKQVESNSVSEVKKQITKIAVSSLLFAAGLLLGGHKPAGMLLLICAYLLSGGWVLLSAARNIIKGSLFDENFLMSLATIGALAVGELPEAAAVMVFYLIGSFFEDLAVRKSKKSISDLMDIRPDYANLQKDGIVEKVDPSAVELGAVILIRPGERVPLDCLVIEGNSELDTSSLTGEAAPKAASPGDTVLSGFINLNGVLTAKVTQTFEFSTVARILDLVQNAASRKSPTENFITRFSRYYTPLVTAAALCTAILPPIITGSLNFPFWINRALVFLVVSCPCALVVSIPLSFFGGIGRASRSGILVKGSSSLEAMKKIKVMVFDKTGTLTQGQFKVSEIAPAEGFDKDTLLELAASVEAHSSHPLAKSITEAWGKPVEGLELKDYEEIPGYGIKAFVAGKRVLAGNEKLLLNEGISDIPPTSSTSVHIAFDGKYAGSIAAEDMLKDGSVIAVQKLRGLGVDKLYMLTGDKKEPAQKIGGMLGLDKVFYSLLPHQKVEILDDIKNEAKKLYGKKGYVAFAGDGINDAPVLMGADIGIAMGGLGSDAAIEAADVVLMNDEPEKIGEAVNIAKATGRIVMQNIIFALCIKLLVMILGFTGLATMWQAVFADVGVTVLAVLNTLRLLRR